MRELLRLLEDQENFTLGESGEKEIHLFDFDGTLFRSPHAPSWWKTPKTWYAGQFSLDPPCVPERPDSSWWIQSTVRDARKSIANPNVWAIACTGRKDSSLRWRVPQLLKQKGLKFDQVFLKDKSKAGPKEDMTTAPWKLRLMLRLCRKFGASKVQWWEDMNMPYFQSGIEGAGITFIPHVVKEKMKDVNCTPEDVKRMDPQAYARMVAAGGIEPTRAA